MKIPTTLKHKPVITVENYENVDGRTAYDSDAKGLSLGLAQWNDRGRGYFADAYRYPKLYDENEPQIDRIGVQGDAMTVSVCTDNPMIDEDIKLFSDALARDDEMLAERLHLLSNLLQDMGYGRRKRD